MDMTGILSVEKVLGNSVRRHHRCHRVTTQSLFKDALRGVIALRAGSDSSVFSLYTETSCTKGGERADLL